jgi:prevent-host-death family protein
MQQYNVAEAKKRLSDLLGQVAYSGETVLITRRGKPMARLVPVDDAPQPHLADAEGWLDDDDPFFHGLDRARAQGNTDGRRAIDLGPDP